MDYRENYDRWCERVTDADLRKDLEHLGAEGDAAIEDAFYRTLEFGTAGLRGVLGAGTNRMNIHTVAQATQGLADYLKTVAPQDASGVRKVAIARDSRLCGELFCRVAAGVLAANGIEAHLYPRLEPTPALSFATRYLHADAGINVTASHNPAQYNGYKAYGPDGCQITSEYAAGIQAAIDAVDVFDGVKQMDYDEGVAAGLIVEMPPEVLEAFVDAVYEERVEGASDPNAPLKLVYTPLNGTGLECVSAILDRIGVHDVTVVPEQAEPDGNFPTCPYPNPEIREALQKGIELCQTVHPDLLLATDPDADRVGIAVEDGDDYTLLSGNEVGVLLLDYICRVRTAQGTMPANPITISTIVSSDMVDAVAAKYGVEVVRCLTGFKYIGEIIGGLEAKGEKERFIFGYEESYGYLAGTHVRDKDAVVASMLICEMARYYRERGMSLVDAMRALYEEFGYFENGSLSFKFEGSEGAAHMAAFMEGMRNDPPATLAGLEVTRFVDYLPGVGNLPSANVLQFELAGGQKMLFRPSGTEPKLKSYLFAFAQTREEADAAIANLSACANELLG